VSAGNFTFAPIKKNTSVKKANPTTVDSLATPIPSTAPIPSIPPTASSKKGASEKATKVEQPAVLNFCQDLPTTSFESKATKDSSVASSSQQFEVNP
jgi:hypothetical protein